jgi:hypothetical protein
MFWNVRIYVFNARFYDNLFIILGSTSMYSWGRKYFKIKSIHLEIRNSILHTRYYWNILKYKLKSIEMENITWKVAKLTELNAN